MKYVLFISTKQLRRRTEVNLPKPTVLIKSGTRIPSQATRLQSHIPDHSCYPGSSNHPSLAELFRGLNQTCEGI